MLKTYRIGRLFGFPIEVNLTFILMLASVLLWMGGLAGVFVVLLGFASVLVHELGHAFVARALGVRIGGIEFHFFGGAAKMLDQPRNARDEILIALAGPAVSVALATLGWSAFALFGTSFFYLFALVNSVIAVFNLLPALPMDGGRVLRAALSYAMPFAKATFTAVQVARVLTIGLGIFSLATAQITLLFLAVALWFMGSAELRASRFHNYSGHTSYSSRAHPARAPFTPFVAEPGTDGARYRIRRIGNQVVLEQID